MAGVKARKAAAESTAPAVETTPAPKADKPEAKAVVPNALALLRDDARGKGKWAVFTFRDEATRLNATVMVPIDHPLATATALAFNVHT